jgi:hypothetical protein
MVKTQQGQQTKPAPDIKFIGLQVNRRPDRQLKIVRLRREKVSPWESAVQ